MTDSPYAAPSARTPAPKGSNALAIAAAVSFVVAGVLELCFLGFAVIGTLMGGAMTAFAVVGSQRAEDVAIGGFVFVIYAVWLVALAVSAPTHLVAGIGVLTGRGGRRALIAGTVASIFPVVTVYCAVTSVISGVLGLVAVLAPSPPPE